MAYRSNYTGTQTDQILQDSVKGGGTLNLVGTSATDLASLMSGLGDNEITLYIITDSAGNFPTLDNEYRLTISGTAKLLLFGKTETFGVTTGDILVVTSKLLKIIPLNHAKAPDTTTGYPGADGLVSPWDRSQIELVGKNDFCTREGVTDAQLCLENGAYPYVNTNIPLEGWGTIIAKRTSNADSSGYHTIEQTYYDRTGNTRAVFKRLAFYHTGSQTTSYGDWVRLDT